MGWLTKILKGSGRYKISKGQYLGKYEDDHTIWEDPPTSVDQWSEVEKEDLRRAIEISMSEQDEKGKKAIDQEAQLEEDEQLARALQESWNVESSPPRSPPPQPLSPQLPRHDHGGLLPPYSLFFPSSSFRICAGCNSGIGHGRYLSCMGAVWHLECFRCHACNQAISDYEFSMSDNHPYHKSCYKDLHHPKCNVCKNFIPTNAAGLIEYRAHPFWHQTAKNLLF